MLVYRDSAIVVPGSRVIQKLLHELEALSLRAARLGALLLDLGELEAALEDLGAPGAGAARQLTDWVAESWLGGTCPGRQLSERIARLCLPAELRLKRPEGYAYYALDPLSYAQSITDRHWNGRKVAVIGIRSIGTSLSAIVRAALLVRGASSERITLRPGGHPWDRRCELDARSRQFVDAWRDAHFVVVDEGPGLSGSTFLSVAEALERCGIAPARIELMTSHDVNSTQLIASRARERWARFITSSVPQRAPLDRSCAVGAGVWRHTSYASESEWPAVWIANERAKYRVPDSGELLKFVGLPPYGDGPLERAALLAEAGFSPRQRACGGGYAAQRWYVGAPLDRRAPRSSVLPRLLEYLALRQSLFRTEARSSEGLETMLQVNLDEGLGAQAPGSSRLEIERPVYADARLLPHEWIATREGVLMKVDAVDHGDDHLLPGPCDSAWDVAGAIVEWQLSDSESAVFLEQYRARTGDAVARRVKPYLRAYSAFRVGYFTTALLSAEAAEQPRLSSERARYLRTLAHYCELDPSP